MAAVSFVVEEGLKHRALRPNSCCSCRVLRRAPAAPARPGSILLAPTVLSEGISLCALALTMIL